MRLHTRFFAVLAIAAIGTGCDNSKALALEKCSEMTGVDTVKFDTIEKCNAEAARKFAVIRAHFADARTDAQRALIAEDEAQSEIDRAELADRNMRLLAEIHRQRCASGANKNNCP